MKRVTDSLYEEHFSFTILREVLFRMWNVPDKV